MSKEKMLYEKNDVFTVTIEDMSISGEGIGKVQGFPFFVKDAVIGDEVEIKAIKVKKNYGYARVMNILTPSPDRDTPLCPIYKQCGGCQIQALTYEKQLEFKAGIVKNNLERIGKLENLKIEPIIGMKEPFYYRNKAQFPVGKDKEGKLITGFYAGRTHSIIPTTECYLGVKENKEVLDAVLAFMKEAEISPYNEETGKGVVRHILIRYGFSTEEIMVSIVINGKKLRKSELLVDKLSKIKGMKSISINVNKEKTNVILGEEVTLLWGQDYITDTIGGISFQISPLSFYQINPVQTEILYGTALEYAGLTGEEIVWDLYCGIGTISLFLAQKAKKVYGVEVVPQAIDDARKNAANNKIENVEFFVGKAEEILAEKYKMENALEKAQVIVVDPPRKGCDEELLKTILEISPEKVVYVSCDPSTLARDVRYLCDGGYEVVKVQPVDMFPQTVHVETVVLLSQQKPSDKIEVDLDLDELEATSAEMKATYAKIKDFVLKEHGLKVSNLYISQVKRKYGLEVGENYNLAKSDDAKQPNCPEEKEKAIAEALKHFGMVS